MTVGDRWQQQAEAVIRLPIGASYPRAITIDIVTREEKFRADTDCRCRSPSGRDNNAFRASAVQAMFACELLHGRACQ